METRENQRAKDKHADSLRRLVNSALALEGGKKPELAKRLRVSRQAINWALRDKTASPELRGKLQKYAERVLMRQDIRAAA